MGSGIAPHQETDGHSGRTAKRSEGSRIQGPKGRPKELISHKKAQDSKDSFCLVCAFLWLIHRSKYVIPQRRSHAETPLIVREMMVKVRLPLARDESRAGQTKMHAVMNGFVVEKSCPDSHHDAHCRKTVA